MCVRACACVCNVHITSVLVINTVPSPCRMYEISLQLLLVSCDRVIHLGALSTALCQSYAIHSPGRGEEGEEG